MNTDTIKILIQKFQEGSLSTKENTMLEQFIESGEVQLDDLEGLNLLHQKLELETAEVPTQSMREVFYKNLEKEKNTLSSGDETMNIASNWWSRIFTQKISWGLGLSLLFGGILLGNFMDSGQSNQINDLAMQLQETEETMMSILLEKKSSTERLKAVHISQGMNDVSEQVINMLLKTLNRDPNVNVRLAAIETLSSYAEKPVVREGLIKSIQNQQAPMVLLALAELMVILEDERSVEEFQELMNSTEVPQEIQNELNEKIKML